MGDINNLRSYLRSKIVYINRILIISSLISFSHTRCIMNSNQEIVDFSGAYSLVPNESSSGFVDSDSMDFKKLKIFAKDYYMQAQIIDSVTSFEIGTYKLDGEKLKQQVIFSSSGTNRNEPATNVFNINRTRENNIQLIKDSKSGQEKTANAENYEYIGEKTKSFIDGAWGQIATYSVSDMDTTWSEGHENFKLMYDGYFIWGDYRDDTYFGLGTFEINDNFRLQETLLQSNFMSFAGTTFFIDVEFANDNEFKQTILDSISGIRYIEVYQRLNTTTE